MVFVLLQFECALEIEAGTFASICGFFGLPSPMFLETGQKSMARHWKGSKVAVLAR